MPGSTGNCRALFASHAHCTFQGQVPSSLVDPMLAFLLLASCALDVALAAPIPDSPFVFAPGAPSPSPPTTSDAAGQPFVLPPPPPPPSPPLRTEPRVFFEISRDVDMKPPPSPRSSPTISMAKMFPPSEPNKELSAEEKLEVWVDRVK